jgi:hypothetical protein
MEFSIRKITFQEIKKKKRRKKEAEQVPQAVTLLSWYFGGARFEFRPVHRLPD